jgi:hypothetical protein
MQAKRARAMRMRFMEVAFVVDVVFMFISPAS